WHNNHHAFQTSARHGLRWWEIDMTYLTIRLMSLVGMAHSIKLPKIRQEPVPPPVKVTLIPERRGDDEAELVGAVS
ncbi:MAG: hypothetical protein ACM35G_05810, partial [Planctomycetaceae bacterium]